MLEREDELFVRMFHWIKIFFLFKFHPSKTNGKKIKNQFFKNEFFLRNYSINEIFNNNIITMVAFIFFLKKLSFNLKSNYNLIIIKNQHITYYFYYSKKLSNTYYN